MKAAYITKPGPYDSIQVGEIPTPVPGPHDLLVAISFSAINPIDLYIRSGTVVTTLPNPFVMHADFSGTVAATGSEVTRFKVGDKIWGSNQGMLGKQGTCAEYAVIHEDWAYPLPTKVSPIDAVAAALTGITAHLGLFRFGELQAGETVFVHGGTGGVGSVVVQMAKQHGCRGITTGGSAQKAQLCRDWGADLVLLYRQDDISSRINDFTRNHGVDVWFETQRNPDFEQILPLM
ncbi:MAG TPA: zinc-binding dehydrogenase, partial [Gemmatales bacterium]|nr:zinc-binding dehydrogenase [Gemmatales bacterium]